MLQKQQICSKMSNVNYRLGALGTLNLPGVANGNMAVGDLLAALKWTKENVAAFGGDPNKITVAGQSAGAWYTVMLTGHPEASKLFKRSIALSYPGSFTPLSKERATELAESLVEGADAEKLRQLSQRLQGAVLRFVKNGSPSSEEEAWPEYCGD